MRASNKEIVELLKSKAPSTDFISQLKITYRPLICPFNDLLDSISSASSVFDIGCGSGMFLMLVAEYKNPKKLGGIEIDAKLVENAKELLKDYPVPSDISVYNGIKIPEIIREYNHITLIDVLHHVPPAQQSSFLKNIYDCMAPGSTLILKDIDGKSPLSYFNKLHDLIFSGEIGNEWSMETSTKTLKEIGFKIETIKKKRLFLYPHYTIIAVK